MGRLHPTTLKMSGFYAHLNKINIGASCILLDPIHDDIDTDLTNLDPQEGIEEFKKAYGEQIQLVENEYGKENVKIEWRLFNWAN